MASVGLFFGSDTGNTEAVAKMIQKELGKQLIEVRDIAKSSKADIDSFDLLMFGIPTWYYGEAQADWDDFFPELEEIDFNNKLVAIFGCGDQEDYSEYFLDAMGTLRDIVEAKGAIIIGHGIGFRQRAEPAQREAGLQIVAGQRELLRLTLVRYASTQGSRHADV